MYAHLSKNYRKIGHSLYKKSGNTYIHVAVVPSHIRLLSASIAWYEECQMEHDMDGLV